MNWKLYLIFIVTVLTINIYSNPVEAILFDADFDCYQEFNITFTDGQPVLLELTGIVNGTIDSSYPIIVYNSTGIVEYSFVDIFNSNTNNVTIVVNPNNDDNLYIHYTNNTAFTLNNSCHDVYIDCDTGDKAVDDSLPSNLDALTSHGWILANGVEDEFYSNELPFEGTLGIKKNNIDGSQSQVRFSANNEILHWLFYDNGTSVLDVDLQTRPAGKLNSIGIRTGIDANNYTLIYDVGLGYTTNASRSVGWHDAKIVYNPNQDVDFWIDNILVYTLTSSGTVNYANVYTDEGTANKGFMYFDNIRVYDQTNASWVKGIEVCTAPPTPDNPPNVTLIAPIDQSNTTDTTPDFYFSFLDDISNNVSCISYINMSISQVIPSDNITWDNSTYPQMPIRSGSWGGRNSELLEPINNKYPFLIKYLQYIGDGGDDTHQDYYTDLSTWTNITSWGLTQDIHNFCISQNPNYPDVLILSSSGQNNKTCSINFTSESVNCSLAQIPNYPNGHQELGSCTGNINASGWENLYMYCFGSGDANDKLCHAYNIDTNSWIQKQGNEKVSSWGVEGANTVMYNGKWYNAGGNFGGANTMWDLHEFNPTINSSFGNWTNKLDLANYPFMFSMSFLIGSDWHLLGGTCNGQTSGNCSGIGGNDATNHHYKINLDTFTITRLNDLPIPIQQAQFYKLSSNEMIVLGGQDENAVARGSPPYYATSYNTTTLITFGTSGEIEGWLIIGKNDTTLNNTQTFISSNTTLNHTWYKWGVNCTDKSSNIGQSSIWEILIVNVTAPLPPSLDNRSITECYDDVTLRLYHYHTNTTITGNVSSTTTHVSEELRHCPNGCMDDAYSGGSACMSPDWYIYGIEMIIVLIIIIVTYYLITRK